MWDHVRLPAGADKMVGRLSFEFSDGSRGSISMKVKFVEKRIGMTILIPGHLEATLHDVSCFVEPVTSCPGGIDALQQQYGCLVQDCFEAPETILTVESLCTTSTKPCRDGKVWTGNSCSTPP